MKTRCFTLIALVVTSLSTTSVQAQQHTEKGAVLGGLAGAIAGAAIGKQNNETTEGALIGGALGLITGAAIGNSKDQDIAHRHAYEQQMRYRMSRAVSPHDVMVMQQNGLTDALIINHIHQNGVQRRIEVSDVIALHQQGVSEAVISAMQRAPLATAPRAVPVRPPAPVIVEQHHYVAPTYHWPHRYHHGHYYHHHHYRPGVRWGISVGH